MPNYGEMSRAEMPQFRQDRPKNRREQLNGLIRDIAGNLNREAEEKHGLKDLLDSECQVQMGGFLGIHTQDVLDKAAADVHAREVEFSMADDPEMFDYYKNKYNAVGEEAIIAAWKGQKKKEKNTQMELAVTALLYKILGDRYFVVRTSVHDDYHSGVDNLIIDKQTGAVVCAFDELHEGGRGEQTKSKREKVFKIARQGGAKLQFGLSMENGKLTRTGKVDSLPVFYLGLSTAELDALMENMEYGLENGCSDQEIATYQILVKSVQEQFKQLESERLPVGVQNRLSQFKQSLADLGNYPKVEHSAQGH